ncbi:MAG: DUF3109 family protein [Balneolales bacterium]
MFQIKHTVISEDVAKVKFSCDLTRCKGACCVVGDAGAPVTKNEVPVLRKAYNQLKSELRDRARQVVKMDDIIKKSGKDFELTCTDDAECIFVTYDKNNTAICAIQKAYYEGRFDWIKPVSCHLFPLRIINIGGTEYINYEYVPSICSPACDKGEEDGLYLSDFLKDALIRKYSESWYNEFNEACKKLRKVS